MKLWLDLFYYFLACAFIGMTGGFVFPDLAVAGFQSLTSNEYRGFLIAAVVVAALTATWVTRR